MPETIPTEPRAAEAPLEPAGVVRRIAAGVYDLLPLAALWMIGTALLMPFTRGGIAPNTIWYDVYLLAIAFAYFGYSWTHGGQTIGGKAWRLKVVDESGGTIDWPKAALRFVVGFIGTALIGVGLLAGLLDPRRRMWQDMAAGTLVLSVPRHSKA